MVKDRLSITFTSWHEWVEMDVSYNLSVWEIEETANQCTAITDHTTRQINLTIVPPIHTNNIDMVRNTISQKHTSKIRLVILAEIGLFFKTVTAMTYSTVDYWTAERYRYNYPAVRYTIHGMGCRHVRWKNRADTVCWIVYDGFFRAHPCRSPERTYQFPHPSHRRAQPKDVVVHCVFAK